MKNYREILKKATKLNNSNLELMLGLVLLTLPISTSLNSFALIFLFLFCSIIGYKELSFQNYFLYWPCLLIFIIQVTGFLISENTVEATKKLVLFLSFLLLPIIPANRKLNIESIYLYLAIGVVLISTYAFGRGIYDILVLGERFDYGYGPELLLKYLPHHAYFSLFILSSILVIAKLVGEKRLRSSYLVLIPFLYIVVFLLPSRTNIFLAISLLPVFIFYFLAKRYSNKNLILVGSIIFLAIVISGFSIDFTRDKITYAYYELVDKSPEDKPFYGITTRKMIWESSIQVVKNSPVFGTGIGDFQEALDSQYIVNGYEQVLGKNSHNQYLQNLVQYGLLLTLIFFLVIGWTVYNLFRLNSWFLISQWIIVLSLFMTESIMNRQWGVVFISVLLSLSCIQFNSQNLTAPSSTKFK